MFPFVMFQTPPLPEPVEAPSNDETPFTPTLPTPPSHHAAPEAEDKPEEKKGIVWYSWNWWKTISRIGE